MFQTKSFPQKMIDMFNEDFYSIIKLNTTSNSKSTVATIELNREHIIYQVHFPNNPITPGVCIIQVAKELLSIIFKSKLEIDKIKSVKFLSPIIPTIHSLIDYNLNWKDEGGVIYVKIAVSKDDTVFSIINMQGKLS